jgi:KipI family sensor histidine kinase inhibitor
VSTDALTAWFGDRAVLVSCEDSGQRTAVLHRLKSALPDVVVRGGMSTVLVEAASPDHHLIDRVRGALAAPMADRNDSEVAGRLVEIDVEYDGPDLDHAAALLGLEVDALIRAHCDQAWQVAMMGFAPGFGYLIPHGRLLADWSALARRADPRSSVPAGSVAVAAGMSAVYPSQMPGGWQLIGRTQAVLFDADRPAPALLAAGGLVRFRDMR